MEERLFEARLPKFPKLSLAVGVLTLLLRGLAGYVALVAAAVDYFLLQKSVLGDTCTML